MNDQTLRTASPQNAKRARPAPWLAIFLLCAVPALAQGEPDQPPSFDDVVDVRVINLEAVVTEGGKRVEGLSPADFQLLIDGEEAPIEYFSEVRNGWAVADGEAAAPSGGTYAMPALEPGESVGTRYLVFVDDYFAISTYRNKVLGELAEQLSLMSADDRMAIVAYDGREVEMLSSWTRSLADLGTALERATKRPAYGLQRLIEERQFDTSQRFRSRGFGRARFASTAFAGARGGFATLDGLERQRAYELASQVEQVADAASSALRAFARPPGRKVMLVLSGGWPSSISNWVAGTFEPVFDDDRLDRWRPFEPLVETANRLGYTLYPVDVHGVEGSVAGRAEYGTVIEAAVAASQNDNREYLEEDTLFELAAATGGRAFVDGAGYDALEGAVEDTRSYYWLGFSPAWQENDEQHRVEVKVRRKGLKVRSRDGYSDLSRGSEITMLVESAQLFDLPLLGETALGVSFGEPAAGGFHKALLPVRLEIPLDYVTLSDDGEAVGAELELRVAATDDDGDRAEVAVVPIRVTGTQPAGAGQIAVLETELKLRRQPHRLLISLYDPTSGNMLSKRVEVSL